MKNLFKLFGVMAFIAVIGLSMVATAGAQTQKGVYNVKEPPLQLDQKSPVSYAYFSPNGKYIISNGYRIWDATSGENKFASNYLPLFSRAGKRFVCTVLENKMYIMKLCDSESGREVASFNSKKTIFPSAFSQDGKLLAAHEDKKIIRLYDAENGREITSFNSKEPVKYITLSSDKKRIFLQHEAIITLLDAETGKVIRTFDNKGTMRNFTLNRDVDIFSQDENYFSRDEKYFLTPFFKGSGSLGAMVWKLWDINNSKEIATIIPIGSWVACSTFFIFSDAGFLNNNQLFWRVNYRVYNNGFYILDVETVKRNAEFFVYKTQKTKNDLDEYEVSDGVRKSKFAKGNAKLTKDGKRILSGGTYISGFNNFGLTNSFVLWDIEAEKEILGKNYVFIAEGDLATYDDYYDSLYFNDDESQIIATFSGLVRAPVLKPYERAYRYRRYNAKTGQEMVSFTTTGYMAQYTPDMKYMVIAQKDHSITVWDVEQNRVLKTFYGHDGVIASLDITDDGKKILSSSGNVIRIWNL